MGMVSINERETDYELTISSRWCTWPVKHLTTAPLTEWSPGASVWPWKKCQRLGRDFIELVFHQRYIDKGVKHWILFFDMLLLLRYLLLILRWVPSNFLWKAIRMQITGCGALSLSLFQKRVTINCCYSLRDWWCWTILYAILVGSAFSLLLTWNADWGYSYWKCLFSVYTLQYAYLIFCQIKALFHISQYCWNELQLPRISNRTLFQPFLKVLKSGTGFFGLENIGPSSYFIFQSCHIPVIFSSHNIGVWGLLCVVRYFSIFHLWISISLQIGVMTTGWSSVIAPWTVQVCRWVGPSWGSDNSIWIDGLENKGLSETCI